MACAVNGMSDERIGEALIKEVIEEELKDVPSEDVPPLTPLAVEGKTEQEEKLVKQLSKMIRIVGDRVQHDQEFQDVIDGVASGSGSKSENFRRVADKVFEDGITWERIAVLIYVAGRLAVKYTTGSYWGSSAYIVCQDCTKKKARGHQILITNSKTGGQKKMETEI
ncbi:bcl-2 homologous antagonist/killer-like isoform X2 [Astatotilapia calliptera]|uniref:bcl-2 homologous antagonist/killer-like isoform X2 n=1 Tax=Astatotilapia calliptera TaxID=8154 RepID=UPI000E3FA925|nr:bcl-2 homologous antagonist/killer-like isoform X2 [Astatotilapia calliptera]XP_026022056.1 bcl-2 homologous antagonist/killer-like isoform X2 [Astatotilapia calliptera]